MEIHNHNLNIHYSMPKELWEKLGQLYSDMPHWKGFIDGAPRWYDCEEKLIVASVEPSGLQFYSELPQEEWYSWFELFKLKASEILGYEVGEPEDGFEFHFYE